MFCHICSFPSIPMTTARIMQKYDVQYYACERCGFIQTETPYWLAEAYSEPLIRSDIGLITRNIALSNTASLVISSFFDSGPNSMFLDYGGGNGMFVRLMRDKGFAFYWYDKYSTNIFALGFEADPNARFDLVTAFEVFEHLPNPLEEISDMLRYSDSLLFSTLLVPTRHPSTDWWYYALAGGQHVSFYSAKSLLMIAERFGLSLYSNGSSLHLLTKKRLWRAAFRVLVSSRLSTLFSHFIHRRSLLQDDYLQITGQKLD